MVWLNTTGFARSGLTLPYEILTDAERQYGSSTLNVAHTYTGFVLVGNINHMKLAYASDNGNDVSSYAVLEYYYR